MLDFTKQIEDSKIKNSDLTNFKIIFYETALVIQGEYIDETGINHGAYSAGTLAYFYIPTEKGYVSSEWKRSKFYKIKGEEISNETLAELQPYLQEKSPSVFIQNKGISKANVIANFITKTGGDIYCNK